MITVKAGSVTFQNVRKTFGAFTAIPDLSLTIVPGTLVTLLGPSGCGKTTTLRIAALTTFVALLLGYVVAYAMRAANSSQPDRGWRASAAELAGSRRPASALASAVRNAGRWASSDCA